jgi:hypothetical protein
MQYRTEPLRHGIARKIMIDSHARFIAFKKNGGIPNSSSNLFSQFVRRKFAGT